MTYRQATTADLEQLRLLGMQAWAQYQTALTPEAWQQLSGSLSDPGKYAALQAQSHCIVCEDTDGTLIGMAFLVPSGNPTDIYPADWCYIRTLSVHPSASGRGIGRQLTIQCIERGRRLGEHTIALHTSEMMHGARHLYESLGFTILREIEPRFGKRYWLYTLPLDAGV